MAFENRAIAIAVKVKFLASKFSKRAGCTITRTRLVQNKETGRASMRALVAVCQQLDVYPKLPA